MYWTLCLSLTGFKPSYGSTHAEAKAIGETKMPSRITTIKFVQLEK